MSSDPANQQSALNAIIVNPSTMRGRGILDHNAIDPKWKEFASA